MVILETTRRGGQNITIVIPYVPGGSNGDVLGNCATPCFKFTASYSPLSLYIYNKYYVTFVWPQRQYF